MHGFHMIAITVRYPDKGKSISEVMFRSVFIVYAYVKKEAM